MNRDVVHGIPRAYAYQLDQSTALGLDAMTFLVQFLARATLGFAAMYVGGYYGIQFLELFLSYIPG